MSIILFSPVIAIYSSSNIETSSSNHSLISNNEWALDLLKIPYAWNYSKGNNTVIGVIDAGIATSLFPNNLWINKGELSGNGIDDDGNGYIDDINGWNFLSNNSDLSDHSPRSHGTAVSSLLIEVAPQTEIMMLKLLDNQDKFYSTYYPQFNSALLYALSHNIDVLYLPLHLTSIPQYIKDTLQLLVNNDISIVASAGQDDSGPIGTVFEPANFNSVIAVGGIHPNKDVYNIGTFGDNMEIVAPSTSLLLKTKNNNTVLYEGTSFSGAMVAGIIALLISYSPFTSNIDIRSLIHLTAEDINQTGKDIYSGYGIIRADRLINSICDDESPILDDFYFEIINNEVPLIELRFKIIEQSGLSECELFYQSSQDLDNNWHTINPCTTEMIPIFPSEDNSTISVLVYIEIQSSFIKFQLKFVDIKNNELITSEILIQTNLVDPTTQSITSEGSSPISNDQNISNTSVYLTSDFSINTGSGYSTSIQNGSNIESRSVSWNSLIYSFLIIFFFVFPIRKIFLRRRKYF